MSIFSSITSRVASFLGVQQPRQPEPDKYAKAIAMLTQIYDERGPADFRGVIRMAWHDPFDMKGLGGCLFAHAVASPYEVKQILPPAGGFGCLTQLRCSKDWIAENPDIAAEIRADERIPPTPDDILHPMQLEVFAEWRRRLDAMPQRDRLSYVDQGLSAKGLPARIVEPVVKDRYDWAIERLTKIFDEKGKEEFILAVSDAWHKWCAPGDGCLFKLCCSPYVTSPSERHEIARKQSGATLGCLTEVKRQPGVAVAQTAELTRQIQDDPRIPSAAFLIVHPDQLQVFAEYQRVFDKL